MQSYTDLVKTCFCISSQALDEWPCCRQVLRGRGPHSKLALWAYAAVEAKMIFIFFIHRFLFSERENAKERGASCAAADNGASTA